MQIRPDMSINEITETFPATLKILGELGFDTCCGGWEEIGKAAAALGIP